MRAQLERTQKDLERVQVSREREAEQQQAKLTQLEEALHKSQEDGTGHSQKAQQKFRRRILAGTAAVGVVLAGGFGVMRLLPSAGHSTPAEVVRAQDDDHAGPAESSAVGNGVAQSEFSQGVGRLSAAFNKFPGVDPETIMRAVNRKAAASGSSVCAFKWNDGQPALQWGGHGGASLSDTLTRCAAAVERFR